jgi:YaiO family outer membrane protein
LLDAEKTINTAKNPLPAGANSDLAEFNALWQLWKAGKQSEAITRASSYLQKNPNDEAVALSLGQFYFLQQNYELATQKVMQLLNKNPSYTAARTTLIDIYLATKKYEQATAVLKQGLALSPTDNSLLQYNQSIKNAQSVTPVALAQPALPQYGSYVEGGALYADLTANYQHWFNQYLKGVIQQDTNNVWVAEYLHGYEYGQKADYGIIQQTHNFNENWYGTFGAGISDNSIYVPKYYVGATLARRFLKSKQLITYFQAQAYWFRPVYKLEVLNPGLIYYFEKPWIIESGVYLNRSNPGRVDTAVGYLAVTQGRDKEHYLTLRVAWGREGYLPLISNAPIVGYPSIVATGTWRQWLGHHWGWNVIAENYHNRFYDRYSVSFGVFKEFSI